MFGSSNILSVFHQLDQAAKLPVDKRSFTQAWFADELQSALTQEFGTDIPAKGPLFIARDGSFIDFSVQYDEAADLYYWLSDNGYDVDALQPSTASFIQVFGFAYCESSFKNLIRLPEQYITQAQIYSLHNWLEAFGDRHQLQLEAPNGTWKTYDLHRYSIQDILHKIQRVYETDILTEKGSSKKVVDELAELDTPLDDKLLAQAERKIVFTPTCVQDMKDAQKPILLAGMKKLNEKIPLLIRKVPTTDPSIMEKVQGIDYPVFQLKVGDSRDKKPIRFLAFYAAGKDGTKYLVLSRFFMHTKERLTTKQRTAAEKDYAKYVTNY